MSDDTEEKPEDPKPAATASKDPSPAPKAKKDLAPKTRPSWLLALLLVIGVATLARLGFAPLDQIELNLYDFRMLSRPAREPTGDVVLAVVDEEAVDEVHRWPWPRNIYARVIRSLAEQGARVVAFNMAFLEPDTEIGKNVAREVQEALKEFAVENPALIERVEALAAEADTDQVLAEAIRTSDTATILGYIFHFTPEELDEPPTEEELADWRDRVSSAAYPVVKGSLAMGKLGCLQAFAPQASLRVLAEATPHAGFLTIPTDPDGAVRRTTLMVETGGKVFPSLGVQSVWNFKDRPALAVLTSDLGIEGIRLDRSFIPTNGRGELLINYFHDERAFPTYSIADLFSGELPAGTFKDKIVVIGGMVKGVRDDFQTPVSAFHSGVEVHATIIDNLLSGDVLVRPDWYVFLDLFAILAVGVLGIAGVTYSGTVYGLIWTLVLAVGYFLFNYWLFTSEGVSISMIYPLVGLALAYIQLTLSRFLAEEDKRKEIEGAFGQYVAPGVIAQVLEDPDKLQLGGEEREITVLFSDLSGFTATSEGKTPSEMVELMCEYFEEMTAKIYDQDGMLKEYVGDELMALFGAPLEQPDHAARACLAAYQMRNRLRELAAEWVEQGRPPLSARYGVNTGVMLVGNLGSSYRFSYGAIGDHVNLGSRLEGLNSQYKTDILIGQNTAAVVGEKFHLREVDTVRVKGRTSGERIFELISPIDEKPEANDLAAFEAYKNALAAYRLSEFKTAKDLFTEVLQLRPDDGPATVMRRRTEEYMIFAPEPDWDGVYTATKK